jgi:hypothetical protein
VSLIYSLLKCLIIAMCCVFIYFKLIFSAGKGSRPTTETSSKKGGKNIPFLDENIPYLEGRGGGGRVPMALTKKIYPVLFLNSRYPLANNFFKFQMFGYDHQPSARKKTPRRHFCQSLIVTIYLFSTSITVTFEVRGFL